MEIILHLTYLVAGLAILWKCAGFLVSGAVGLAGRLGVSRLVIGLTVVAMGTSTPEAAASIAGVLRGPAGGDIAIGNVYGSNIANLALVAGLIALIRPLQVRKMTLLREVPAMLVVELLLWPLVRDSHLVRIESLALLAMFAGLLVLTIRLARREGPEAIARIRVPEIEADRPRHCHTLARSLFLVAVGLAGLAAGAKMTVEGAVFLGTKLGISQGVIALTVIAFGTSLPELVTCVVAAVKGHHDISVGNLVGSNIFNTLLVTGAAGMVRPFELSLRFAGGSDYWIMIAVSAAFAGAALIGRRSIGRIQAVILVTTYAAYLVYLFGFTGEL